MAVRPDCPRCGSSHVDRDAVDVGVGTQYGPWACFDCGWLEWDWTNEVSSPAAASPAKETLMPPWLTRLLAALAKHPDLIPTIIAVVNNPDVQKLIKALVEISKEPTE